VGLADGVIWLVAIAFAVCAILVYRAVKNRLEEQEAAQRMADAAFEAQILGTTRSTGSDERFLASQEETVQAFAVPAPPQQDIMEALNLQQQTIPAKISVQTEEFSRQPADITCAGVISQLRNAGMLEQVDGYVELNGNSKAAAVLRLKGGRFALVVPYHESEMFTHRNLKKYQMLLYVGRDGKACVVTSLEETIAARVAGSAGF
jgi:hypothetical protein